MKKTTWIKIAAILIAAIPPIVVLCLKFPMFTQRTDKTISAAALLVLIICALIFKDGFKKLLRIEGTMFSAFKICLFIFVISYISVSLGEEMLIISLTALVSGACALPFNIWYAYVTRPATTNEVLNTLKELTKESKENEKEESDQNN